MKLTYPKLYCRDSNGGVRVWWMEQEDNAYWSVYGVLDGKMVKTEPIYAPAKNVGKKNETTPVQQGALAIQQEYKKQKRLNYFEDINDIDKGFLEFQLAKPSADYIDKINWEQGWILDDKLNGFACAITAHGAVTRANKKYHSIPHILKDLAPVFEKYPDAFIQGELFNPINVNYLNRISEIISVIREPKDITPELLQESEKVVQFHAYDGYHFCGCGKSDDGLERRKALERLFLEFNLKYTYPVRYHIIHSKEEAEKLKNEYIKEGGEGKILRNPRALYQHKRTKDLLKLKKLEDAEFQVLSIEEGKGNWAGCAKFAWCKLPNGVKSDKFKSNIDGDMERNRQIFQNRDKYVGKFVTVRFEEYSEFNVPLKPYTDMIIREEVEGKI